MTTQSIKQWAKEFLKKSYHFLFIKTINEQRLQELKDEHFLKYHSHFIRM